MEEIFEIIHECQGNAKHVYQKIGYSSNGWYLFMEEHPEVREELEKAREYKREDRNDAAETALDIMLRRLEEDPERAFKSAKYILDNHGKDRGWNKDKDEGDGDQEIRVIVQASDEKPPVKE